MRASLADLRELGFCVLSGVVPEAQLERVSAAYDRAFASAVAPDLRTSSTRGDRRLVDLVVAGGPELDELYQLPSVLAACREGIGQRFKLSSFHGRTVLPGAAEQPLHVDVRREQDGWPLLGFIVMIDEFRADNGATRFVPGSHHAEAKGSACEGNQRRAASHVAACGTAGSVIIYFGSTWHGYSANRSGAARRSIQGAYIPRDGTASAQWVSRMTPQTLARLSPTARHLLAID